MLELNERPRPAIDGLISQLVTVPPLTLGVFVDIVSPLFKSISCVEYMMLLGATSSIVMFTVVDVEMSLDKIEN